METKACAQPHYFSRTSRLSAKRDSVCNWLAFGGAAGLQCGIAIDQRPSRAHSPVPHVAARDASPAHLLRPSLVLHPV